MRTALSMTTLVLLALTTTSSGLHAQAQPGQDVRWKADHVTRRAVFREVLPGGRILVDLADSAMVLDPGATEIEYRNGSRTRSESAAIGFMVAGAVGAVVGYSDGDDWVLTAEEKAAGFFVLVGAAGAIVGAIALPVSKWIPLRTDARPAVALLVEPQRLGVSLRF